MLRYVNMFGSASVFDGGNGEIFLKWIVKDLVRNTQKVPAKLVEQLSFRKYGLDMIEHAFEYDVKKALDLDYKFIKSVEKKEFNGNYTMIIGCTDQHGRGNDDIEWKDQRKKKTQNECKFEIEACYQEIFNGSEMDWCIPVGWLYHLSDQI